MANYIVNVSGKNIKTARYNKEDRSLQMLDSFPSIVSFFKEGDETREVVGKVPIDVDEKNIVFFTFFDNFLRHSSLSNNSELKRELIRKITSIVLDKIRRKSLKSLSHKDQVLFITPFNLSMEFAVELINYLKSQDLPNIIVYNDIECALAYCYHSALNKIEIIDWLQLNKEIKIYFYDVIKKDLNLYIANYTKKNGNSQIIIERAKVIKDFSVLEEKDRRDDLWEREVMDILPDDFKKILFFFIKRDSENYSIKNYIEKKIGKLSEPNIGKRVRELKIQARHDTETFEIYGAYDLLNNEKNVSYNYNMSIGFRVDNEFFCEIIPKDVFSFPFIQRKAFTIDTRQTKLRFDFYIGTDNRIDDGWLLKSVYIDFEEIGLMVSEIRQIELLLTISLDSQTSGRIWLENINKNLKNGEIRNLSEEISFKLPFNLYIGGGDDKIYD